MLSVFVITFPFFALVACGYAAARLGMLPLSAIPGLNGFVLFFALPCLLLSAGCTYALGTVVDARGCGGIWGRGFVDGGGDGVGYGEAMGLE
jgi:hypothetical protein